MILPYKHWKYSRSGKQSLVLFKLYERTYSPLQMMTWSKAKVLANSKLAMPIGILEELSEDDFAKDLLRILKSSCPKRKVKQLEILHFKL
ncbi:unnamed protein product [Cuscuta campestris]|uniref:Uncharacterized protein n=1 Tax=Cuscuta campestris TaxID=132261 RepID=A0A484NC93_9ASTE|nr:unnamed protein product [Cuscuta campestris]